MLLRDLFLKICITTYMKIIFSLRFSQPLYEVTQQLICLYNTFCYARDSGKKVRVVCCNISKAFDRVWHAGLSHKLRSAGVTLK